MKLWAKLGLRGKSDAGYLVEAFFGEFNPASSIMIKGNEAWTEIIFDARPKKIIEAITQCEIIEFRFGRDLTEPTKEVITEVEVLEEASLEEKEQVGEAEQAEETEQAEEHEETSNQAEDAITEEVLLDETSSEVPEVVAPAEDCVTVVKESKIAKLEEIAKEARSFGDFAKSVGEYLEMDRRQQLFENLASVAAYDDKGSFISWKMLEAGLKARGINITRGDKIQIGNKISKKFGIGTEELIREMAKYMDFSFKDNTKEIFAEPSPEEEEEEVEETVEPETEAEEIPAEENSETEVEAEEPAQVKKVKMACMPEIPWFEEVLGNIDKDDRIDNRVKYVIQKMGIKDRTGAEQQVIFEVTSAAARTEKNDFVEIMKTTYLPPNQYTFAQMTVSRFINEFVQNHGNPDARVKSIDFLLQLREVVN